MDWMPQAIREGIFTILFISGPLVILAAGLGLTIGVIQAATQVQEQTLGSAVKIIGLFLALIVFGFYIFQYLKKYTEENMTKAFRLVPTLESHPLPRKNFLMVKADEEESNQQIPAKETKPMQKAAAPLGTQNNQSLRPDTVPVNPQQVPDSLPASAPPRQAENNIRSQALKTAAPSAIKPPTAAPQTISPDSIIKIDNSDKPVWTPERKEFSSALRRIQESVNKFHTQETENAVKGR
jgi:flagellar biosynthetic protein FliQ